MEKIFGNMCRIETTFKKAFGYHPTKDVVPPLRQEEIQKAIASIKNSQPAATKSSTPLGVETIIVVESDGDTWEERRIIYSCGRQDLFHVQNLKEADISPKL